MATARCIACSADLSPGARFCPRCGRMAHAPPPIPPPPLGSSAPLYAPGATGFVWASGNVRITPDHLFVGQRTFALKAIGWASRGEIPPRRGWSWLLLIVGVVLIVHGCDRPRQQDGLVWGWLLACAGLIGFVLTKPAYTLRLGLPTGPEDVLRSTTPRDIDRMIAAMNEAATRSR